MKPASSANDEGNPQRQPAPRRRPCVRAASSRRSTPVAARRRRRRRRAHPTRSANVHCRAGLVALYVPLASRRARSSMKAARSRASMNWIGRVLGRARRPRRRARPAAADGRSAPPSNRSGRSDPAARRSAPAARSAPRAPKTSVTTRLARGLQRPVVLADLLGRRVGQLADRGILVEAGRAGIGEHRDRRHEEDSAPTRGASSCADARTMRGT